MADDDKAVNDDKNGRGGGSVLADIFVYGNF